MLANSRRSAPETSRTQEQAARQIPLGSFRVILDPRFSFSSILQTFGTQSDERTRSRISVASAEFERFHRGDDRGLQKEKRRGSSGQGRVRNRENTWKRILLSGVFVLFSRPFRNPLSFAFPLSPFRFRSADGSLQSVLQTGGPLTSEIQFASRLFAVETRNQ